MLIRIAFGAALLAAAVPSCSTDCSEVGCFSGMLAHVTTSLDTAGLRQASVSICRNASCLEGSAEAPVGDAGVTGFVLHDSSGASALVSFGTGGAIDITYNVQNMADLHDGDRYVITVTDGAGAVVGSVDKTVNYATDAPNGADCGPVCRKVTL